MRALALMLLLSPCALAKSEKTRDVCPRVRFVGPAIKLSEMEKKLVCGDPGSDGWKKISLPQARQFMTAFLQSKGHHFPEFTTEGETLEVRVGTTTHVKVLTGSGLAGIYEIKKRRHVIGQLLTPSLLDDVKKGVMFELQSRGFACPQVVVTADARTGEVHADAQPGPLYKLEQVNNARIEKVDPSVFDRYRSYQPNQLFDNRMLSLTSDRIKTDELFLSAYYDVQCSTAGLLIMQRVVEGKPRLLTIGIGADTEGLLQAKLRGKLSRLGKRASSAEVDLFASGLQQSLDINGSFYLSDRSRLYLYPEGFVRREEEIQYEAAHSQAAFEPAWSHDGQDIRIDVRGGPAYDYFNTIRGEGPKHSDWAAFTTHTQLETHLHEYYARDPRRGWRAALDTDSRARGIHSRVTANRLYATGEALWNLGGFEPPLLVAADRGLVGTTAVQGDPSLAFTEVPPTDRFFLGGDADIRGFQRNHLPNDAAGFLTAAYDGFELRLGDALPANIQPLVFIDAAMGGRRDFHFDPDVYYSPGAGFRWAPSFGDVRATMARGLTWRRGSATQAPRPRWQFFFSFGKEF